MPRDIPEQVAGFVQLLDREQSPITVDELVELSASALKPSPRRDPSGVLVAVAAAAAVILVVGGLAFLLNTANETDPVATTSPPTTAVEATPSTASQEPPVVELPEAEGTVTEYTGRPVVIPGTVGPVGSVDVQHVSTATAFLPTGSFDSWNVGSARGYGGIVETPDGYTALGVTTGIPRPAIATSTDGIEWEIIDFPLDIPNYRSGGPARLFEAGGWYWIGLNEPYLYRSSDTIDWERIDLNGSTPRPMGVPLAGKRWQRFGDQLVSPTGSSGLIAVDITSGEVQEYETPWGLPGGYGWWWMTEIDGKLTAFVSSVPDTVETAENPVVEQYETTDLLTWDGPFRPVFTSDKTTGVLVSGDTSNGLLAWDMAGEWYGYRIGNPNLAQLRRYYSADGKAWTEFVTLNENPGGDPSFPDTSLLWDESLTSVNLDGQQALAALAPNEVHLSVDGISWQVINLQGRPQQGDGNSFAVLGNRIFHYSWEQIDGTWQLHTWVITIGG